jgi:glycosyltransferase involved in cell wall biosynthesis
MQISIITINYNNQKGLQDTIQSVLSQSFENFEYIIIDGQSSDGSIDIIKANEDKISYWESNKDDGIYNAMNKGIKKAKGDFLLFLNSGDVFHDDKSLKNAAVFLETGLDIYYGNLLLRYQSKDVVKEFPNELSFYFFVNNGYLPHPSTFINRKLFENFGLYDESYKIAADWDFFIRLICKHNASYKHINSVISIFDKQGISNDPSYIELKAQERDRCLNENFSPFVKDIERLVEYDKHHNFSRFKMLRSLESNSKARKMNSFWLSIMTKIFNRRDQK